MTTMKRLPDAELDVMKVVWQHQPPVTAGTLLEGVARATDKEWKPQTLHTLLNRLVERGFLSAEKAGKEKHFCPLVTRDEYLRYETRSFVNQLHGGSLLSLVNTAYQGENLTDDDLEELVAWAHAKRGEQQP